MAGVARWINNKYLFRVANNNISHICTLFWVEALISTGLCGFVICKGFRVSIMNKKPQHPLCVAPFCRGKKSMRNRLSSLFLGPKFFDAPAASGTQKAFICKVSFVERERKRRKCGNRRSLENQHFFFFLGSRLEMDWPALKKEGTFIDIYERAENDAGFQTDHVPCLIRVA